MTCQTTGAPDRCSRSPTYKAENAPRAEGTNALVTFCPRNRPARPRAAVR
jgi:hypothetical protein